MRVTLKLTRVGMNMQEATIVEWHKQPGERFVEGDVICVFETDKVTQEIEATASGTLLSIAVPAGEDAEVGDALCTIDLDR